MRFGNVVPETTRWAREYETIYILRPNVDGDEADKVAERVRDVFEKGGGKITKVDTWGKRKLAYTIKKHTRGIFIHLTFVAPDDLVAELERNLRLAEPVMRFQTIRLRDQVALNDVEIDAEATAFERIEVTDDEEDETYAERLGMAPRRREEPVDENDDDDDSDDDDDDDDSSDDSDDEESSDE